MTRSRRPNNNISAEKAAASLARAAARGASRAAPRPAPPSPSRTRAKPPVVKPDPAYRTRKVSAIAERLERREGITASEGAAREKLREREKRASERRERALAAVLVGEPPDVERADDLGTVVVDDPLDHTARPARRAVVTSLRDDPVGRMAKRKQITETGLRSARRWQELRELSEIGGARAIDYSVDRVDGGRLHDPYSLGRLSAADVIAALDVKLGEDGALLVRRVLAEKLELVRIAELTGETPEYLGKRFRACLATLGRAFGYDEETRGTGLGKIVHSGEQPTMHEWNYRPDEPTNQTR